MAAIPGRHAGNGAQVGRLAAANAGKRRLGVQSAEVCRFASVGSHGKQGYNARLIYPGYLDQTRAYCAVSHAARDDFHATCFLRTFSMKPAKEVRVGNIIMVDSKPFIV